MAVPVQHLKLVVELFGTLYKPNVLQDGPYKYQSPLHSFRFISYNGEALMKDDSLM